MKKIILVLSIALSHYAVANEPQHDAKEEKVIVTEIIDGAKVYGDKWQEATERMDVEKAIAEHEMVLGETMVFTGNITKVCQKSGCWMMLESNGKFARVDFNKHSFFIPKDTHGTAEVYGILHSKTMSDKMKKHLESEGAGKIAEKVYEITATSVKIKS